MPRADRLRLLAKIQKLRDTHVISYVTSTRSGLEIQMAMDSVRRVYDHLKLIGRPKSDTKVDLFLHSNGGDGTVPWRLVTLIREYASKMSVLVPYKAFSAATLTALGADSVVMHPMGMLGPTDPTVTNPFNPRDPSNANQPIGISVEDVTAYIALVKEDAGITHEDELVQAFNVLAQHVHPLALGNVKRSLSQSRMMARKLLALHMNKTEEEHKIKEIVDSLTSKLFYHGHPINRREALEEIGLSTVEDAPQKLEDLMWRLYLDYEAEIKMEEPFNPALEFVAQNQGPPPPNGATTPITTARLVFIESLKRTDVFSMDYQIRGLPHAQTGGVIANTIAVRQGWRTESA